MAWGGAALAAQLGLAALALAAAAAENPDLGAETWVVALIVLAPPIGAGLIAALLWLLPPR